MQPYSASSMGSSPEVSIIVPVRQAATTIHRTLAGLVAQCAGCNAEILVLLSEGDATIQAVRKFDSPRLRVLVRPAGQGVPQLRRDGVFAAAAPLLVITEDHCTFPKDWLRRLIAGWQRHGGVVGGAVANGRRSYTGWAQYFTRYAAFLPPVPEGAARFLPGNNAIYARSAIEPYLDLLREGFWEAEFNHALAAGGQPFRTEPELTVEQHQDRGLFGYMPLRYRHGRCYGWRRSRSAPRAVRWKLLAATPLVPALLFLRAVRQVLRKPRHLGTFLLVSPLLLCYFAVWAAGEAAGYLTGGGKDWWDTD